MMNFFSNVHTHNFKNLYSDFETEGKTIRIHIVYLQNPVKKHCQQEMD